MRKSKRSKRSVREPTRGKRKPKAAPTPVSKLLGTNAAAAHLRMHPKSLARLRSKGTGPKSRKIGGKVYYDPADLDAWSGRTPPDVEEFDRAAPETLARPDAVNGAGLSEHNWALVAQLANVGYSTIEITRYLGLRLRKLDTTLRRELETEVERVQLASLYRIRRSMLRTALESRNVADRQLAEKVFGEARAAETRDAVLAFLDSSITSLEEALDGADKVQQAKRDWKPEMKDCRK